MHCYKTHGVTLECRQGDIANQPDMDVIVNAANAQLLPGAGVAGAIHRAAGPGLARECRAYAPIAPGQAVISGAHGLPNKRVIHCLGPVYGRDEPSDRLLADCYRHALQLADQQGLESIAFPAISTGVFSYPIVPAAHIAIATVLDEVVHLTALRQVRFVLFSADALTVFEAALAEQAH